LFEGCGWEAVQVILLENWNPAEKQTLLEVSQAILLLNAHICCCVINLAYQFYVVCFLSKPMPFFFLCGTGELRAYNLSLSASPFFLMMIGSRELFAQDGFKLQSF
jgi:hypothetical protein